MEPWGTPKLTGALLEWWSLTFVIWYRSVKYDENQSSSRPCNQAADPALQYNSVLTEQVKDLQTTI